VPVKFVTLQIEGQEGLVRNLFAARDLGVPAARATFPGVPGVAIMPREFDGAEAAATWMQGMAEQGGVALAVRIGAQRWLVGAWVSA
jgi:hypothetical protein